MIRQKNMFLFYFSITLVITSSILYHFVQKSTPGDVNFSVSLLVSYVVSLGITLLILFFFPPKSGFVGELRRLNWASYVLALSLVGLEIGWLLVYRAGWSLGVAAVLVNVAAAIILVPVTIFIFKDELNSVNIIGILICLVGLFMLNWKR
jgi:drug/metabolite transporter (DMT)-like permease